ncbi:hypothetical protein ACH4UR_36455 [Streptomyces lydicus]|uniref:hypothetical protein n=1 Tax=Streptomyces lydicus TaxID=47763 RepID=UPI0033EEB76D
MSDPEGSGFSSMEGREEQQAFDAVRAVVSWYADRIAAEGRAPVPDEARVRELKAARRAALDDQAQLATADPEEAAGVAAFYAARLRELAGS